MVLKKQTVWLLTMLSLIVVLSVYYVTTPTQSPTASTKEKQSQSASAGKGKTENVISNVSDDQFASLKLQRDHQQSSQAKELQQVIAADNSTATQVSDATSELQTLNDQAKQEALLEDEIVAKGFGADAVITTSNDGNYATVYVNAKSLSNKQASQIMQMVVKSSLGVQFANVKYQVQNG